MKKIFLYVNTSSEQAKNEARSLEKFLAAHGANIYTDKAELDYSFDCMISVGGDGTFLRAARAALRFGIPVLGINLGRLGFMTELEASETKLLERLFTREYKIEKRMLLDVEVIRNGETVVKDFAINEAVIRMGSLSRMLDLKLNAHGRAVSQYRADGILFSTPVGSTGYALSAGGPIMEPHMNSITTVPICAHGLDARPIVFSKETELSVTLSNMKGKNAYISIDGMEGVELTDEDVVKVEGSEDELKIIKISSRSFYDQLGTKLKF